MLNIQTRIRTDLNPFKRIRSRIRSENIRTVFIPTYSSEAVTIMASPTSQLASVWPALDSGGGGGSLPLPASRPAQTMTDDPPADPLVGPVASCHFQQQQRAARRCMQWPWQHLRGCATSGQRRGRRENGKGERRKQTPMPARPFGSLPCHLGTWKLARGCCCGNLCSLAGKHTAVGRQAPTGRPLASSTTRRSPTLGSRILLAILIFLMKTIIKSTSTFTAY